MSTPLLEVEGLQVRYGDVAAVHGVSLHLMAGEIATLIGPNGAGKSTTLNAILGILPASGSVRLEGADISRLEIEDRVASGIGLVAERRELFAPMSVADNLVLGAHLQPRRALAAALEDVFRLFPRLRERRGQIASTLSGGERQMLAIGRALMARPRVLLLDEPSLGLAPRIVAEMFAIIRGLRERGVAILLVEQNARAALAVSDRGYVLEMGRIVLQGASADLAADERVARSYLGQASVQPRPIINPEEEPCETQPLRVLHSPSRR
jgi:branched-chain amino acid transport system ATP-binding protein